MEKSLYSCEICSFKLTTKPNLARHIYYRHCKKRPLYCPECGVTGKSMNNLVNHGTSIHGKVNLRQKHFLCIFEGYCPVDVLPKTNERSQFEENDSDGRFRVCFLRRDLRNNKRAGKASGVP